MSDIRDRLTPEDAAIRRRLDLARTLILSAMQQRGDRNDYSVMMTHARVKAGGWSREARNELRADLHITREQSRKAVQ